MAKLSKTLSKIIVYLIVVLLAIGLFGIVLTIFRQILSPTGMYIVYANSEYDSDNDGIVIEWKGSSYEAVFTITNTDGWGAYSVTDCTVKVISNVTDSKNFDFTVDGENYSFSNVTDLSAAFAENYTMYDGNGIQVDEDGNFSLYFDIYYTSDYIETAMETALSRVYVGEAEISTAADISSYPYFAVQVMSPDDKTTIIIPFAVNGTVLTE